jgi:hypothetical protein
VWLCSGLAWHNACRMLVLPPDAEHKAVVGEPCCNGNDGQADSRGEQHQTAQLLPNWNPHLDHSTPRRCAVSVGERSGRARRLGCSGYQSAALRESWATCETRQSGSVSSRLYPIPGGECVRVRVRSGQRVVLPGLLAMGEPSGEGCWGASRRVGVNARQTQLARCSVQAG